MKRFLILLGTFLLASAAFAQDDAQQPSMPKSLANLAPVANTPVTQAEARATFQQFEKTLRKVLNIKAAAKPSKLTPSPAPATREQVVEELTRLFEEARPKFTFKPHKIPYSSALFALSDAKAKADAGTLVAWGFAARLAPLVCGPGDVLLIEPFGDAVGFFIARIAELAHMPSSRFSPYLNGPEG